MEKPDTKTLIELLDRAVAVGAVAKAGNWFSFGEQRLGHGRENAVAFLADNSEISSAIAIAVALIAKAAPSQEPGAGHRIPGEEASGTAREAPSTGRGMADEGQTIGTQSAPPQPEFVTLSFPLPPEVTEEALKAASIVVKAQSARGRWRAGWQFTREERVIPYAVLSGAQIAALTGDPELAVSVRIPKAS